MLCMMANTIHGRQIKKYYIELEKLVIQYLNYQTNFYKKKYKNILKEIKNYEHIKLFSKKKYLERIKYNEDQKNRIGFVYFINEGNNYDYFKIGCTYNLEDRLKSLQTGNRRKLKIYKSIKVTNIFEKEKELHNKFKSKKILNEWYKIDINDI